MTNRDSYIRGWCEGYKQALVDMAQAATELSVAVRADGGYICSNAMSAFEAECVGGPSDVGQVVADDRSLFDDPDFQSHVDGGSEAD